MAQLSSIRTCVILETISARSLTRRTCLSVLDAVTQMTRLAQLDRGVPLQLVTRLPKTSSSGMQSRSILAKDTQLTRIAQPDQAMEVQ